MHYLLAEYNETHIVFWIRSCFRMAHQIYCVLLSL